MVQTEIFWKEKVKEAVRLAKEKGCTCFDENFFAKNCPAGITTLLIELGSTQETKDRIAKLSPYYEEEENHGND